jgi:hypothetical protein
MSSKTYKCDVYIYTVFGSTSRLDNSALLLMKYVHSGIFSLKWSNRLALYNLKI